MGANNRTNRQNRILDIVRQNTISMLEMPSDDRQWIHASAVSEILNLDRANVARELNNLYRDGDLIKLQGKPTLYICREALAQQFPGVFFPSTLPKGSRLEDYSVSQVTEHPRSAPQTLTELECQVGADASMKSAVLYAKAAVMYPGHGLHTLITGSVGVGKSQLAMKMYNHAISKGALPPDAPFIVVNCRDHTSSPRLLLNQLFGFSRDAAPKGEKSRRGLIDRAAGGILCLNGIERLPADVQDVLITLLEKNTYTRVGEPSIIRKANVMVIALSTESAQSPNLQSMNQRFPVHIPIPDLRDRTTRELAEILMDTFQAESVATDLSFRISKEVFSCFLKASYPSNLGELNSAVRTSCSLVYLEYAASNPQPRTMEIGFRHLPADMLQAIREDVRKDQEVRELLDNNDFSYILFTPVGFSTDRYTKDQLLDIIHGSRKGGAGSATQPVSLVISLEHLLYVLKKNRHTLTEYPKAVLDSIPSVLMDMIKAALGNSSEFACIAKSPKALYQLSSFLQDCIHGLVEPMPNARRTIESLQFLCAQEMEVIGVIQQQLLEHSLPPLSDTGICCLTAHLNHARQLHNKHNIPILLVCHGRDVATNLADYVNQSIGTALVYGLCYQDGITLEELVQQSEELAQRIDRGNGILLMSDMSPLTELHDAIYRSTGIPCESISGVNLPMLLSVTHRIIHENVSLRELITDAQAITAPHREPSFQDRIRNEILSSALSFLDPQKAMDVLSVTLTTILQELHLAWSTEIATKFIIHCSHMLERLILGEPLAYDRLKFFVNQHGALVNELERQMRYPAEVFGVFIPASELAYVAEIFLPYLH